VAGCRLRFDRATLHQLDALPPDVGAVARRRVAQLTERPRPPDATELAAHPTYSASGCPAVSDSSTG